MNGTIFFIFCFPILSVVLTGMSPELKKLLGLDEIVTATESGLRDELKKDPGTLLGSMDDMAKYPSQSDFIEAAMKNLEAGNVQQYTPAPIQTVECHVEFQVMKRIPGRCTRLPGAIPACQTEKYIGINYNDCN